MQDLVLNWSSGKDAALAFYYLQHDKHYRVVSLLTSLSAKYKRVSMHGVPETVLHLQAAAMQLPLRKIYLPEDADMESYDRLMADTVSRFKSEGVSAMAFGDIFLEDLRQYRETRLATAGMNAVFPLWKKDTVNLVQEVEDAGIKAMLVCVNDRYLGKEFLGRYIDRGLLQDLPENVDPCGENGEFHSLVVDAPYFNEALPITKGEIVYKKYGEAKKEPAQWDSGFYFLDVKTY